jgi:hypothetical protein
MKKLILSFSILGIGCMNKNNVDLCKCLTEPGNSEFMIKNGAACDQAISEEIGVSDYTKINFSENPAISRKFDELASKCNNHEIIETAKNGEKTNDALLNNISTHNNFVWESINMEAQLYTTLAFDKDQFRTSAYSMNGKTNSAEFTKIIDLSGEWTKKDDLKAEGIYTQKNVGINWTINPDYKFLTNNKGVVFKRIKIN